MSLASFWANSGISIAVWKPSVVLTAGTPNTCVVTPRGVVLFDQFHTLVDSWQHESMAVGGYTSAEATVTISLDDLDWWLENALGAHIEVNDGMGVRIWEGFVDSLAISGGPVAIQYGPLSDVENLVRVFYQKINPNTVPSSGYEQASTAIAQNTNSQMKWGIWKEIITGGQMTTTMATTLRDTYLTDRAWPKLTQTVTIGGQGAEVSIRLSMVGYHARMDYTYRSYAAGTQNLSTKIAAILNHDTNFNGLFSSANADITTNTLQVPATDLERRKAWTILKELESLGDATFRRYTLQIGPDRKVTYAPIPDEISYQVMAASERQIITDSAGSEILPWQVQAGKWARVSGLFVGRHPLGIRRDDPRYLFIESMRFSAPDSLTLSGGDSDSFPAILSQAGILNAR